MIKQLKQFFKKKRDCCINVMFIKEICGSFYRIKILYSLANNEEEELDGNCCFFMLKGDGQTRAFYPDSYSLPRCCLDMFKLPFELSSSQQEVIRKRCCFEMDEDTLREFVIDVKLTEEDFELLFDASNSRAFAYLEKRTKKMLSFFEVGGGCHL